MAFEIVRVPLPERGSFWSAFVLLLPALIGTPLVYAYRWIVPEPYGLIGAGGDDCGCLWIPLVLVVERCR